MFGFFSIQDDDDTSEDEEEEHKKRKRIEVAVEERNHGLG